MRKPVRNSDVVIVGGGIAGCGAAWELAKGGARVVVLERAVPGAEASSAAAGILGAQVEAHAEGPLFELALASRELYPGWARELARETGVDIEFRRGGVLRVEQNARALARLQKEHAFQRRFQARVEHFGKRELEAHVPGLASVAGAVAFPEDGRVDPPKLLRALRIAAERAGAEFRGGAYVERVLVEGERTLGVELGDGSRVASEHVLVAAGSWSSLVRGVPLPEGGVQPARGQIVELLLPVPITSWVVFGPRCYLSPRDDGRVLVGSTMEFVGYRREVTAKAVRDLLDGALELLPALGEAALSRTWSSFRPFVKGGLPLLGATRIRNLWLSTGHHRNGILLAPVSAKVLRALIQGKRPPVDVTAFAPERQGENPQD